MRVLFKLPEEIKCPVCNRPLYFGIRKNCLDVMISCQNWKNGCISDWRDKKEPINIPWHFWAKVEGGKIIPDYSTIDLEAHIHKDKDKIKNDMGAEILNILEKKYPTMYHYMIDVTEENNYFLQSSLGSNILYPFAIWENDEIIRVEAQTNNKAPAKVLWYKGIKNNRGREIRIDEKLIYPKYCSKL